MINSKKKITITKQLSNQPSTKSLNQNNIKLNQARPAKPLDKPQTQNDLASTTTQLSASSNRVHFSGLQWQKNSIRQNILPKSSQMSQGHSPMQDHKIPMSPQDNTRVDLLNTPPQLNQKRMEQELCSVQSNILTKQNSLDANNYFNQSPPVEKVLFNSSPFIEEPQTSGIRGTFQREQFSYEQKQRQMDQKKIMKEFLDKQIQEKKSRLDQEKMQELERAKKEEERLKKQIEDEQRQQEFEKLDKIKKQESQQEFLRQQELLKNQPLQSQNQTKRQNNQRHGLDDVQVHVPSVPKTQHSEQPKIEIDSYNFKLQKYSSQKPQKDSYENPISNQSELIQFLTSQMQNLKEDNNRKDSLIQQLINKTDKPVQSTRVNKLIIKTPEKELLNRQTQKISEMQNPRLTSSQSTQFLQKHDYPKLVQGVPKTSQETKKVPTNRLPQITTPQPQVTHIKKLKSSEIVMNTRQHQTHADQKLMYNLNKQSFKRGNEKVPSIRRKTHALNSHEEEHNNWSFGNQELNLVFQPQQSHSKQYGPTGDEEDYDTPLLQQNQQTYQKKLTFNHSIQQNQNYNSPPHYQQNNKGVFKQQSEEQQKVQPVMFKQLQQNNYETPTSSNFLKYDFQHINPGFTFSSSIGEQFRDIKSNPCSTKKLRDKLPKEFQIAPLKRKFFI